MIDYPEYDSPLNFVFSPLESVMKEIGDNIAKKIDDSTYEAVLNAHIEIDRDKLIAALNQDSERYREAYRKGYETAENHMYSPSQVAEILTDLFGDPCACNFNGIDEWLPEHCEFRDTCCPNPTEGSCWEQYLKHKDQVTVKSDDGKCPYYQGVCGLDEQYVCFASSLPEGCSVYQKHMAQGSKE